MNIIAQHWLIDLAGLDRTLCLDGESWVNALLQSSHEIGASVISKYCHVFYPPKPPGITAYVLLDSSHFSVHTYADDGKAALDLFACTERDLGEAFTVVKLQLGLKTRQITLVKRLARFS